MGAVCLSVFLGEDKTKKKTNPIKNKRHNKDIDKDEHKHKDEDKH
jgi:hypothetical protein